MKPLISVIIPAHNSGSTIAEALDSIISQTYKNLEIIIVDDNSTDATEHVVKKYTDTYTNIRYYKLPYDDPYRVNNYGRNINAGYMARNYAFDKINGEWVTFQDADDVSFRNRIEIQYALAEKYAALHICLDWQQYNPLYKGKIINADQILQDIPEEKLLVTKEELYNLSQRTKGIFIKIFGNFITSCVPFGWKRFRIINKLFFGSLLAYPGTGNSPLFKRSILNTIQFRQLKYRIWPSFVGRGADRDFNFQVAEKFKNSITVYIPAYMWRVDHQNEKYKNYGKYIRE